MSDFTISDGLIIAATLLGPVLAVQTQKWIERAQEKDRRREYVFHTLMATRATRLSPEHLRALNSISLAYQGTDEASKKVRNAWKAYLHNLSADLNNHDQGQQQIHFDRRAELFVDLLAAMADERKFEYDRVSLKTDSYHPQGAGMAEMEAEELRRTALALLRNESGLIVKVVE